VKGKGLRGKGDREGMGGWGTTTRMIRLARKYESLAPLMRRSSLAAANRLVQTAFGSALMSSPPLSLRGRGDRGMGF